MHWKSQTMQCSYKLTILFVHLYNIYVHITRLSETRHGWKFGQSKFSASTSLAETDMHHSQDFSWVWAWTWSPTNLGSTPRHFLWYFSNQTRFVQEIQSPEKHNLINLLTNFIVYIHPSINTAYVQSYMYMYTQKINS